MDFNDLVLCWPGQGTPVTLSASAADIIWRTTGITNIWPPCDLYIVGLQATVTTQVVNSSAEAVVAVMVHNNTDTATAVTNTLGDAPSGTTGEVCTLSFPTLTAVGTILQTLLTPDEYVLVKKSDAHCIVLRHKTQGVGSAAGVARVRLMFKIAGRTDFSTASSA